MKLKVLTPIFAESASKLVHAVGQYETTVLIRKDHWVIDAKSLLGLLAISLQPGDVIELSVEDGTEEVINDLVNIQLFERNGN